MHLAHKNDRQADSRNGNALAASAVGAGCSPTGGRSAEALKAEVLSIGDGDTIRVRRGGRAITVRLACIDASETAQRPYGHRPAATCSNGCRSAGR